MTALKTYRFVPFKYSSFFYCAGIRSSDGFRAPVSIQCGAYITKEVEVYPDDEVEDDDYKPVITKHQVKVEDSKTNLGKIITFI